MKNLISALIAMLLSLVSATAIAQSTAAVTVTGWGMRYGGKVIYRYQVRNSSPALITSVLIGHFSSVDADRAELSVPPRLASPTFWVPTDAAARPSGWGVLIRYEDESSNFSLEWVEAAYFKKMWPSAQQRPESPISTPGNVGIPPGATWDNFSVSLREADPGYVTGHATIDYGDEYINVPIQKGDTLAPTLALSVERVNQNDGNGNWAIFDVRASASDNYDPGPTLDFAPVTANQPIRAGDVSIDSKPGRWRVKLRNVQGRTYRLQVSSSDASGNKASKSFDYVVPGNGKS